MVFKKGQTAWNRKNEVRENTKEIIKLYNKGNCIKKITEQFKCDYSVIKRILEKENMNIRPQSFYMKGRLSEKKGKTYEELYGERANEMRLLVSKRTKEGMDKPELRKFLSDRLKGKKPYKMTNEIKLKLSNSKLGPKNPMFGKFGKLHPKFNKKISDETRNKLKISHIGIKQTEESILKRKNNINFIKGHFKKGQEHPNWNNGSSFEPYTPEFNKEFKYLIRFRDNFSCINCGISEQKHLILTGKRLHVHHMDYDKRNTCLQNCCTLCHKCNLLANKNRKEWTEYYREKLSRFYGYKYDEKGNVILSEEEIICENTKK